MLGALNTLYLTVNRFLGSEAACPTDGCVQVLGSRYATLFGEGNAISFGDGVPLALFGLISYVGMAGLALGPMAINSETAKKKRLEWEKRTWFLLFLGATGMMLFSAYLMFIMTTEFVIPNGVEAICVYCIASAIFATTMFVVTVMGRAWEDRGQLVFSGLILGIVTILATLLVFAPSAPAPDGYNIKDNTGKILFTVQDKSSESQIALAQHLKEVGATMYGAYWCSHCFDQKKLFGVEALSEMPYVECDSKGINPDTQLCATKFKEAEQQTKAQAGYPTWEINGKFYSGTQQLSELAKHSGYDGPQNF